MLYAMLMLGYKQIYRYTLNVVPIVYYREWWKHHCDQQCHKGGNWEDSRAFRRFLDDGKLTGWGYKLSDSGDCCNNCIGKNNWPSYIILKVKWKKNENLLLLSL